ncbi:MAG: right-handed parallel beta-helix repeat-containing protein [Chitinophagaceae bacterium]
MKHQLFFIVIICILASCENTTPNKTTNIDNATLPEGIQITVAKNKDTQILITKTDTLNSKKTIEEIRPYIKTNARDTFIVSRSSTEKINYLSLPSAIAAVYNNLNNLLIENLQFTNPSGNNLVFNNCTNIVIRNCFFGDSFLEAISISGGNKITIENNLFANNMNGVYALKTTGGIVIRNNQFVNIKGREPRGQYIQFDSCFGEGNIIDNNKGECWPGESNPEDLISIYKSRGTEKSPILIRNNIFRGGGPSESGGGIMTGDRDGSNVIVENNILVDPGQYGIAVAGGNNIIIRDNKIFGRLQNFTNVGIYAWAQSGAACSSLVIENNNINFTRGINGDNEKYNLWDAKNCGPISGWSTNRFTLTLEELKLPVHLINFVTPVELLKIRGK